MSLKQKNLEKYILQHYPQQAITIDSWKKLNNQRLVSLSDYLVNNEIFPLGKIEKLLLELPWDAKATAPDIPNYQIIDRIGQGGMGEIFKVIDRNTRQPFAVKILLPQYAQNEQFRKRFFREGQIATQLTHPNITKCIEIFSVGNTLAICFEWGEGGNLQQFIDRHGELTPIKAIETAQMITQALDYFYDNGLIHRDIKPANILLPFQSPPKLADFGLARTIDSQNTPQESILTMEGSFIGTLNYCSPEQLEGTREIDTRSDIYSLGATLYYCLTGKPPFSFQSMYQATKILVYDKTPVDVKSISHIPKPFAWCLERMMANDPAKRYQTPKELLNALSQLHKALSQHASPVKWQSETPPLQQANNRFQHTTIPQSDTAMASATFHKPRAISQASVQSYQLNFHYYDSQSNSWIDFHQTRITPGKFTIGRKSTNDICLRIPQSDQRSLRISGTHCQIALQTELTITDLNSTNGTFINDRRIIANKQYPLQANDTIILGKREVRFIVQAITQDVTINFQGPQGTEIATPKFNVDLP